MATQTRRKTSTKPRRTTVTVKRTVKKRRISKKIDKFIDRFMFWSAIGFWLLIAVFVLKFGAFDFIKQSIAAVWS